jgi:hypothetical protein
MDARSGTIGSRLSGLKRVSTGATSLGHRGGVEKIPLSEIPEETSATWEKPRASWSTIDLDSETPPSPPLDLSAVLGTVRSERRGGSSEERIIDEEQHIGGAPFISCWDSEQEVETGLSPPPRKYI